MGEEVRDKRRRLEADRSHCHELPLGEGGAEDGGQDLISRLPDDVLGDIIILLPTRDGACTQAISRWWRPLWRAAPLNLQVDRSFSGQEHERITVVNKILSNHPGPARRFVLLGFRLRDIFAKIDGLLRFPALTGLQEIKFNYLFMERQAYKLLHPMPSSALRFAPTLRISDFGYRDFPNEMVPSLSFPHLKNLVLRSVTISEGALHSLLSSCSVLESLLLPEIERTGQVRISSATLRSVGFSTRWSNSDAIKFQELVIEDAPCLERLMLLDHVYVPTTIRVMKAPKLEIMGILSAGIFKLQLGTTIFQEMFALSLSTSMHIVKVLSLDYSSGPNLDLVVDFLKCFPCVETLYIMYTLQKTMKNERPYNLLDPIECLELHLKKVVVNSYHGMRPHVAFSKFFVLNVKVLKEMDFGLSMNFCRDEWIANQCRTLQLDNKASLGARFVFVCSWGISSLAFSNADPFEVPHYKKRLGLA